MISTVFLDREGKYLSSRVSEDSASLRKGCIVKINSVSYRITDLEKIEHLDYQFILIIAYAEKSNERDEDEL